MCLNEDETTNTTPRQRQKPHNQDMDSPIHNFRQQLIPPANNWHNWGIDAVKNEGSGWLTNVRDSAVLAAVQVKTGVPFSDGHQCSKTRTKFCSHLFVSRHPQAAAQPADRALP